MDTIHRVVIHDKHPAFEPEILSRPINRVALGVAGAALLIQVAAFVQVTLGKGQSGGWFDHAAFSTVSFVWWALGVLVFLQRRARLTGQFFLLSAAAGSIFLSLGTLYAHVSLFDSFAYTAGVLLFPVFLLSFTRAFQERRPWSPLELLFYVPAAIVIWPGAHDLYSGQAHPLWRAGIASVGIYLVAALIQTLRDLATASTPEQEAQARVLLTGLAAGVMPALILFISPLVVTGQFAASIRWMPPLVFLFLIAMSFAVLLFEFTEADLIVRRGIVSAALTLVIASSYGALGVVLLAGRSTVTNPGGSLGFVIVTVLVGTLVTPVVRLSRRLVDWLLYGGYTDRWEVLQALSGGLATVMQPEQLGDRLVHELIAALHLRGAFLMRRVGNHFVLWSRSDERQLLPDALELSADSVNEALGDPPRSLLLIHAKPLTVGRSEVVPERYRDLDQLRAALTIPLVTSSGLEAVLCLQPKLAHDAFDSDDLELLAPVIRQAAAALDNSLLFARLDEKVGELREAYVRIAREQEAERARLARELHDGTAQELAGLITLAAVVERQMEDSRDGAHATLDRLRKQAEDAYQGVRRASHALRPLMLDDFGLAPTLERYLDGFQQSTGILVEFSSGEVGLLPDDVELALFRVAQECLENVRKHSGSKVARLGLWRNDVQVSLMVDDLGRGIEDGGERGIGLAGMRERVEAVGGSIVVESAPERGVHVTVQIPMEEEAWKAAAFASS